MNYLAHAFISPVDNLEILLGNLAGDSIRHIDTYTLPEAVQTGIQLHQLIDRTTDAHSSFRKMREHISRQGFPYPGVVADLVVDFVLGSRWDNFSQESFRDFKQRIYTVLNSMGNTISQHLTFTSAVLVMEDWFESYRTIHGMNTAFQRLNRKTSREVPVTALYRYLEAEEEILVEWGRSIINDVKRTVESRI